MEELTSLFSSFEISSPKDQTLVAKCMYMCPLDEISFREQNGLLHRLELIDSNQWNSYQNLYRKALRKESGTTNGFSFTSHHKAVKQYQRSSAGQEMYHPEKIRPIYILKETVDYLLGECLLQTLNDYSSKPMEAFGYYYDFTFDRLRSIRQDMIIQRVSDARCFYILERCIDFYIYSHYVWAQTSTQHNMNLTRYFNAHINQTHLQDSLHQLISYYDLFNDTVWSKYRARYESLYMLYNLRPNFDYITFNRYQKLKLNKFTSNILDIKMKTIKLLIKDYVIRNHMHSLRIIRQQREELISCLFYIVNMSYHHLEFLKLILVAYKSPTTRFPLSLLAEWFFPSSSSQKDSIQYIELLCQHYEIPIESNRKDYFNSENSTLMNEEKFILITKKFPNISQWIETEHIIPVRWLPQLSLNHYERFIL